jgi:hypothetical protein
MPDDISRIWPYAIAIIAVFLIYRRLRRSFGRQPVSPVRMGIRIGLLLVLGASLLPAVLQGGEVLAAELGCVVAGAVLGLWGARHTRYITVEGRLHYVPHTITGVAVSLLFIGRLIYRLADVYSLERASRGTLDPGQAFASPALVRSPLTMGLLFVVVGYYVCYYSLVLWKSKRIGPEDLEAVRTSTAASE